MLKQLFILISFFATNSFFIASSFAMQDEDAQAAEQQALQQVLDLALLEGAKKGNIVQVKAMINAGANVNVEGFYVNTPSVKFTPLSSAAIYEHEGVCEYLITMKANVDQEFDDNTALTAAATLGLDKICKMLIEKGADVNYQTAESRMTALHSAAIPGDVLVCKLLLSKGINIELRNKWKQTALEAAELTAVPQSLDLETLCNEDTCKKIMAQKKPMKSAELQLNKKLAFIKLIKQHNVAKVGSFDCKICLDTKTIESYRQLDCGHEYCQECLLEVVDLFQKEHEPEYLKCPNTQCKESLSEFDIVSVTGNSTAINLWDMLKLQKWIALQPDAKQCPKPNCTYLFLSNNQTILTTCQLCSHEYCSNCLKPHDPSAISCVAYQESILVAEKANMAWHYQNSRPCPTCSVPIHRDAGCWSVCCSNCNKYFCYDCLFAGEDTKYPKHECKPISTEEAHKKIKAKYLHL